jgi:anti-anti-sigma factor
LFWVNQMAFNISVNKKDGCTVINCSGVIRLAAGQEIYKSIKKVKDGCIIVDFTDANKLTSQGIGLTLSGINHCKENGLPICIVAESVEENRRVRRPLQIMGVKQIVPIHQSLSKALDWCEMEQVRQSSN